MCVFANSFLFLQLVQLNAKKFQACKWAGTFEVLAEMCALTWQPCLTSAANIFFSSSSSTIYHLDKGESGQSGCLKIA